MACNEIRAPRAWMRATSLREVQAIEESRAADLAVWRTAKAFIKKHGTNAEWEAAGEADNALAKGQWQTVHTWKRVYQTIQQLQR